MEVTTLSMAVFFIGILSLMWMFISKQGIDKLRDDLREIKKGIPEERDFINNEIKKLSDSKEIMNKLMYVVSILIILAGVFHLLKSL